MMFLGLQALGHFSLVRRDMGCWREDCSGGWIIGETGHEGAEISSRRLEK
jgi:hypothetical protein